MNVDLLPGKTAFDSAFTDENPTKSFYDGFCSAISCIHEPKPSHNSELPKQSTVEAIAIVDDREDIYSETLPHTMIEAFDGQKMAPAIMLSWELSSQIQKALIGAREVCRARGRFIETKEICEHWASRVKDNIKALNKKETALQDLALNDPEPFESRFEEMAAICRRRLKLTGAMEQMSSMWDEAATDMRRVEGEQNNNMDLLEILNGVYTKARLLQPMDFDEETAGVAPPFDLSILDESDLQEDGPGPASHDDKREEGEEEKEKRVDSSLPHNPRGTELEDLSAPERKCDQGNASTASSPSLTNNSSQASDSDSANISPPDEGSEEGQTRHDGRRQSLAPAGQGDEEEASEEQASKDSFFYTGYDSDEPHCRTLFPMAAIEAELERHRSQLFYAEMRAADIEYVTLWRALESFTESEKAGTAIESREDFDARMDTQRQLFKENVVRNAAFRMSVMRAQWAGLMIDSNGEWFQDVDDEDVHC